MQCSVFIAMSLDGFIARRDGSIDWLMPFQAGGDDYGYAKFAATTDAMIMGRGTYDTVLGFPDWSPAKRTIVMTHRSAPPREHVELFDGPPAQLVARLREQGIRRAYVDGGNVIRQFLAAGLIDDMIISIIPVLLGDGLPLFGGDAVATLRLDSVERWPNGLAQLRYSLKL
jgi:dihydrofolate reductase